MKRLRILLADDHDFVRRGLGILIEQEPAWRICGEAKTGTEAVQKAISLRPDIAVVDFKMSGLDGLEVTRRIRKRLPSCEVLIFTGSLETDELIREAFNSGAKSFILKTEAKKFLVEALKCLAEHRPFFTDKASAILFARYSRQKTPSEGRRKGEGRLSPDEQELVRLLTDGHSNVRVAKDQCISIRTVENRRAGIMRKLRLSTFADLVRYAVRNGIIDA